ncbi:MAG: 4'-phosphopantetheinyl transferase superfamily protein [Bacteroidales bacterium]|nr:4'-phosphopantetheinyl transferase superfamily protein [Bacteroidales bacterium]
MQPIHPVFMIKVYYAYTNILEGRSLDCLLTSLSSMTKSKLAGFKRKEDRFLRLTSCVLLSKALMENGYSDFQLFDIQYTDAGRPYFQNAPFDFNISHTDNCAILAFSENGRVGIDVEKIKEVDLSDFETVFSEKIWDIIFSSEDKNGMFYYYWTILESAVKADGRGLSLVSSKQITILNDQVLIDGKEWYPHHKNFDPSISCCVMSTNKNETIEFIEIESI